MRPRGFVTRVPILGTRRKSPSSGPSFLETPPLWLHTVAGLRQWELHTLLILQGTLLTVRSSCLHVGRTWTAQRYHAVQSTTCAAGRVRKRVPRHRNGSFEQPRSCAGDFHCKMPSPGQGTEAKSAVPCICGHTPSEGDSEEASAAPPPVPACSSCSRDSAATSAVAWAMAALHELLSTLHGYMLCYRPPDTCNFGIVALLSSLSHSTDRKSFSQSCPNKSFWGLHEAVHGLGIAWRVRHVGLVASVAGTSGRGPMGGPGDDEAGAEDPRRLLQSPHPGPKGLPVSEGLRRVRHTHPDAGAEQCEDKRAKTCKGLSA